MDKELFENMLEELKGTCGRILQSSLSDEEVDRLQSVLAEAPAWQLFPGLTAAG